MSETAGANATTDTEAVEKPEAWSGKLVLRKPVMAHGEELKELTFREPTSGDIIDIGMPVTPQRRIDTQVMAEMLARLALVPPPTIRSLHPNDFTAASYLVADFFI
jgi:leucyl aminopeptidase (aminopeptidase T)